MSQDHTRYPYITHLVEEKDIWRLQNEKDIIERIILGYRQQLDRCYSFCKKILNIGERK